MPKNNAKLNNTVMVYVSTFDSDVAVESVEPAIRNELIQRCTNQRAKQQRYCVWRLFDYALRDCYDGGVADFDFYIDGNGKWNSHNCISFSLAHCNNVVAVAVCNHAVGIDVEAVANFTRHSASAEFSERVLADNEQLLLQDVSIDARAELLAKLWTKKESIFKLRGASAFVPKSIDTTIKPARSQLLTLDEQYVLSVATYIPAKIELVQIDWKLCK